MFRLKELRLEYGLSRAELSRLININQGTLYNYENQTRQADYKTLATLARFFDTSIDYLIGANDQDNSALPLFKPLSAQEKNFLTQFRALSEKSKDLVVGVVARFKELEKLGHD